MKRFIIYLTFLLTIGASKVTRSDLESRAGIIYDMAWKCINQLEERLEELELLTLDSTAPEKRLMVSAKYDTVLAAAKARMVSIKALSPPTSDLLDFIARTGKMASQIRELLKSLILSFPSGIETSSKHTDLLAFQNMWLVDLDAGLADLGIDLARLSEPQDSALELDWALRRLDKAYKQMCSFIGLSRVYLLANDQYIESLNSEVDDLLRRIARALHTLRTDTDMTLASRRERLDYIQTTMRNTMLIVGGVLESPAIGLRAAVAYQLVDQQLPVLVTLNLVRARLAQMEPKYPNHIEDLIKYVEEHRKNNMRS